MLTSLRLVKVGIQNHKNDKLSIDSDDYIKERNTKGPKSVQNFLMQVILPIFILFYYKNKFGFATGAIKDASLIFWMTAETWGAFQPFYPTADYYDEFPALKILENNHMVIKSEYENMLKLTNIQLSSMRYALNRDEMNKTNWDTLWIKTGNSFIPNNVEYVPQTTEILKQIPNLSTTFFSRINANSRILPHWGYHKGILRVLFSVIAPVCKPGEFSGIRVNVNVLYTKEIKHKVLVEHDMSYIERNDTYTLAMTEGKGVMFDDTYLHDSLNDCDGQRVALFIDIKRDLPWYLKAINELMEFASSNFVERLRARVNLPKLNKEEI